MMRHRQRYMGRCTKEIKTLLEPEIGECVTIGNTLWNCTSNYTRDMYPRSDEYMELSICRPQAGYSYSVCP